MIWKSTSTIIMRCNYSFPNSLRPRQNRRHFPDDILKCIILKDNVWISLEISLKFVAAVRINNIPALVRTVAWCRPGDKPLFEPVMVDLLTHLCVTRPQWARLSGGHSKPLFNKGHPWEILSHRKIFRYSYNLFGSSTKYDVGKMDPRAAKHDSLWYSHWNHGDADTLLYLLI